MHPIITRLFALGFLAHTVLGFAPQPMLRLTSMALQGSFDDQEMPPSRRNFLHRSAKLLFVPLVACAASSLQPRPAWAADSPKVLVLGGTGFVGSRVVRALQEQGVSVTATSRDGRDGTVALDVTKTDVAKEIESLAKGFSAIISCIGAIGSPNDGVVNAASGLAAQGAKAAGVERFVYISVAPEVKEFAKGIDFLDEYMKGKTFSQSAITSSFPNTATLIEPTFIYGGDSFSVSPPRVASFYGEFIEALLSSGPVRGITNIAPQGFIKIALEPPVSVEAVAAAAVNGALGSYSSGVTELDTYDKIKAAAAGM
ncbi:NAD-dependent epimerase/dehydratase [Nitzschia inconspicua]|uniref:NAD-dependent epimerase/dehydratase n=1 Tax=Nitzschia inconspicua TaxID=303405 RepID=A0A9K3LN16_9STRA|nr:NAD-dependent epimerase/dehydratase [Nitzschia inconspicua]